MAPAPPARARTGASSEDGAQGEWKTVLPKSAARRTAKAPKRVAFGDGALGRSSGRVSPSRERSERFA
eukprot:9163506-Alexandrium_andersonii.AAC.1